MMFYRDKQLAISQYVRYSKSHRRDVCIDPRKILYNPNMSHMFKCRQEAFSKVLKLHVLIRGNDINNYTRLDKLTVTYRHFGF